MKAREELGGACRPPQTPRRLLGRDSFSTGGLGGGGTSPPAFGLSLLLRLAGLQGQAPWNLFSTTLRIGVTGLSRAGKTAFLTSAAANLLARTQPRFSLAPLEAGDVPRFDHAAHLAALGG